AGFILWPRGDPEPAASSSPGPSAGVIVGEPGGEVQSAAPSTPVTPIPTVAALASPTQSATPMPVTAADGFTARVLACRSISGSSCNGELGNLPPSAGSFTALVLFTDAVAGDTMNAILSGPSGTIPGAAYSLRGGGDGYYYSTFTAGGLPAGDYTITATRNGDEVAVTTFRKVGG
ncbi:MAG: hypothetical protein ACRDGD_04215, partial [Candidatus Limnocylindria bacterium]